MVFILKSIMFYNFFKKLVIIDFKFEPLIFDVFFVNTKTSSLKFENISQKKWGIAI